MPSQLLLWLCDCSGSMAGARIASLNYAVWSVLQAIDHTRPRPQVSTAVVAFGDAAVWHLRQPAPASGVAWRELRAGGETAMGAALELVAAALAHWPELAAGPPPVLVLVSDGQPTDDFEAGRAALAASRAGRAARRCAVAIGDDADLDVLESFVGPGGPDVLRAHNAEQLLDALWAVAGLPVIANAEGAK